MIFETYCYNLRVSEILEPRLKESPFVLIAANGESSRLLLHSKYVPPLGLNQILNVFHDNLHTK